MAKRSRICLHCSCQFEYDISQGADRKFCSKKCRVALARERHKQKCSLRECIVEGCEKPIRSSKSIYCEMHYGRVRRGVRLDVASVPKGRYEYSQGYVVVLANTHPLADNRGRVYEHRKVFYDAHGEGPFRCHVCQAEVNWEGMHVDHLDDDPRNNVVQNLAPACPACNQWRGKDRRAVAGSANAKPILAFGEDQTIAEWSRRYGVPHTTIRRRLADGWLTERAISTPSGPTGHKSNRKT
jgi:hypothetical protein